LGLIWPQRRLTPEGEGVPVSVLVHPAPMK
jgi:hypothetical protein